MSRSTHHAGARQPTKSGVRKRAPAKPLAGAETPSAGAARSLAGTAKPFGGVRDLVPEAISIPSSQAKQDFANLIQRVVHSNQPSVITRHNQPVAVLLSVDAYQRLVDAVPDPLASLRQEFDQLLATMRTPRAKAGVDALFAATPTQLGAAALKAARRGGH